MGKSPEGSHPWDYCWIGTLKGHLMGENQKGMLKGGGSTEQGHAFDQKKPRGEKIERKKKVKTHL